MKCFVSETLVIFLLCFLELFKVTSSDQRPMDIIDNFIGLAEPNNNEIERRNSIVDGGVFVPYKSTTIVYKSRLVPVTYGFVIKKETLKDNPALYKLGVKLLDEKVESTPKQVQLDEKKVEPAKILAENQPKLNGNQRLDAKSNCVRGSKLLRLLGKLTRDINKIEKAILAQNQSVESEHEEFIAKSLKKKKARQKLHPQNEVHVSGHKGAFEKVLNIMNKKPQKQNISKNLSRYWQCRRSHTKTKCAMFLVRKHVHNGHNQVKHPARYETTHRHSKDHRKHDSHTKQHLNKHNNESTKSPNKHNSHENPDIFNNTKHLAKGKHDSHEKQHLNKHNNESTTFPNKHNSHENPDKFNNTKHLTKGKHDSHEKQHLNKHNNESTTSPNKHNSHENPDKFNNTKHLTKGDGTKNLVRNESYGKNQDRHKNDSTTHPTTREPHQKHHRKQQAKPRRHDTKHVFKHDSYNKGQLDNKNVKRHPIKYRRKPKNAKKKKVEK